MGDIEVDLSTSNDLLRATFGDPKYDDESLLRWQYRDAPEGSVVQANLDEDGSRLGHYAIVPQRYVRGSEFLDAALSLNTAVAEEARGRGLFTSLATEAYELARAGGIEAVYGVANANSTPGFLKRLGFTLVMALPPVLAVPLRLPPRSSSLTQVTPAYLVSSDFSHLYETLDLTADTGWARSWTIDVLRWRLSQPGARYAVVETSDVVAIVTVTHHARVPVVAILKLFARKGAVRPTASNVVAAACTRLRAPAAVYAGFNAKVRITGVPIPKRLRPSPLNLIVRSFDDGRPVEDLALGTFEFLDFDAY